MSELLVCEGATLTYAADPLITAVSLAINSATSTLATKVKCGGNKVYEVVGVTVTGLTTSGGFAQTTPAAGAINGSTVNVKANGASLVRAVDTSSITVTGTIGSTAATYPITVKISNPGQTKVKAV